MIEAEYEERSRSIHAFCEEIRKYREENRRFHEETMRNHRELIETIKSMMNDSRDQMQGLPQSLPATQILPIENSTQTPIEVSTQSPQAIDDNTPQATDHNTQSPQAIDHVTQSSPTIDNTQIEHSRVIHPARDSSNGRACLPRSPPNYPNGRPRKLGEGIKTVPLLMKEFNHIDSNEWRKSDKERRYISVRRSTVVYVRLSSRTTPIVKDFPQMDLLELYRVRKGLKMSQLAVKINTFNESTESVGGRTTKTFTSSSKKKVDELLREYVAKSPEALNPIDYSILVVYE